MKKLLAYGLVFLLCISMLASCTTPASETPETGQESRGETIDSEQYLNVLISAEPSVLDVVRFLGVVDRNILNNILEPLVRIENGVLTPAGAERWEVSEDGLTYTFYLRENYWNDGVKVVAEDYANTIRRWADPANAHVFAADSYCIKNFEKVNKGELPVSEVGVEAIGDDVLKLHMEYINVALLSTVTFWPERADVVAEFGDKLGTEAHYLKCCGPFVLDDWIHNSELKFVKNEKYWNVDNVKLERWSFHIIPDTNAQYASLENGSLDYLGVSDQDYIDKFRQRDDMSEMLNTSARTSMVIFNCKDDVFKNVKVRQAFSLAINREEISEVLNAGLSTPAYGMVPPACIVGQYNFRESVTEPLRKLAEQYPDPKALLSDGLKELGMSGDPSELTVTLNWGSTSANARTNAEYYQQMWQDKLGVTVELEFNDSATHLAKLKQGDFQMGLTSWGAYAEPQFQLSRWSTGGQSHWERPEYAALLSQAVQTVDDTARLEIYKQAEEMIINEAAIAPVAYTTSLTFYYNYVKGLSTNPFDTAGMKNLYTSGRK